MLLYVILHQYCLHNKHIPSVQNCVFQFNYAENKHQTLQPKLIKFYTPPVGHFRCLRLKGTHGAVQLTGRSRHTVVAYEAFVRKLGDDDGALYTCQTLMPQRRLIGCTLWFAPISLGVNGKEGGECATNTPMSETKLTLFEAAGTRLARKSI